MYHLIAIKDEQEFVKNNPNAKILVFHYLTDNGFMVGYFVPNKSN